MDKVAFRSCQRRNKMKRINKQSKTAESLANYLSSVEIANNEKKRSRLDFEHKLGYNIKTDSKSLYAYVRSKSRSKYCAGPVLDSVAYLGFHFEGGGSKFFWKSGGICMALRAVQRVAKPRVC